MEITHDLLLALGFVELDNYPTRYAYRGITGRLERELGLFYFHGFGMAISLRKDLEYMLMLIEYQQQATLIGYPSHQN